MSMKSTTKGIIGQNRKKPSKTKADYAADARKRRKAKRTAITARIERIEGAI